jgi:hypothetical protein
MDCSVSRQQTSTSNSLQLCARSRMPVAQPIGLPAWRQTKHRKRR